MRVRIIVAATVAVLLGSTTGWALTVIDGPYTYSGHLYYLFERSTWADAEAAANALGGHLATVNDAGENVFIANTFTAPLTAERNLWIGLTDKDVPNVFVWVSGEPVTYLNWASNEPNDAPEDNNNVPGNNDESYVGLWGPGTGEILGTWNDFGVRTEDRRPLHGVAEVIPPAVPEPASGLLLALGLGAGLASRVRGRR